MVEDAVESPQSFDANSDICQQLLTRYAHSSAAQHRHLCATAAATRSIIQASSLALTPVSYFAATITSLSNSDALDATALAALTSFISIVVPLVGKGEIKPEKAGEAVSVLMRIVEESGSCMGTSGVRAVVKCVGVLVAEFCDLNKWSSVAVGFEWLLKFSLDKRPKVRKCAQDCLLTVFKLFESPSVSKKASELIYSLLKDHMPLAVEMSASEIVDGPKKESMSRPEHQEVLHLLNVMKHVVPYLSLKYATRTLSQLSKILSSKFSTVTRHVFDVISVIFETSATEVIIFSAEDIFNALVSYISTGKKNPVETVLSAATLAKTAFDKLLDSDISKWITYLPKLTECLVGLLSSEADVALQASGILRELIDHHVDAKSFLTLENQEMEDKTTCSAESKAIEATCTVFYNILRTSSKIPNEHFFSVVAFLFLKLGDSAGIFMKDILLKLADMMNKTSANASKIKHLQDSIGSAVAVMGPEKLLSLLPLTLNAKDYSCSNIWLLPILEKNIVGSSLQFFMEHIVPLAESIEQASCKVKKSVIRQDLQAYAHGCWGLLPAFCRQPSDTHQSFEALAKTLISFLKKDSFILENITLALQELVNQNKSALTSDQESLELMEVQRAESVKEFPIDLKTRSVYSREIATENLKALSSCSKELLQALTNVLFESPPEMRKHLKGAIGCLMSISDSSITKQIFISSLEKFQLLDDIGEHEKVESETKVKGEESRAISAGTDANRCLILDLASCVVEGCGDDLVNLVFSVIMSALQVNDETSQMEAYQTLSRILEKYSWFCSSQFAVVMDLLTGIKSSANITLLRSRFACLRTLLIHALMSDVDEENTKVFLILNEIILTLKDSNEEGRKAAYDALHEISSKLRNSSDSSRDGLYHKFLSMITGYLSDSSPHIKSGVVSALSVLVYSDPDLCIKKPDVVPSVLELLHSKSVEIIKAVLGFVKVLVSCLKPHDVQNLLPDIIDGIIRWSSVSRHHFRTKIIVILEILIRKCGPAAVKVLAPEKYKDFMQGVIANRHGKTSAKEVGNEGSIAELPDSSPTEQHKRKRVETANSSKEDRSSMRPLKRKRDKNHNGERAKNSSDNGELQKGKSNKNLNFTKEISGRKKVTGRTIMKKNDEGNKHISKSLKQKRSGKKGHKSS